MADVDGGRMNPWGLTPRQVEVMRMACELGRDDAIAEKLHLQKQTVKEHLMRSRRLMGGLDMRRAVVVFDRWDGGRDNVRCNADPTAPRTPE